jgi:hypothetical protein
MVIYRIDRPPVVEKTSMASVIQTDTLVNNVRTKYKLKKALLLVHQSYKKV